MDRRPSHVSPELNITIQAESEPEDSPAGPSNSHQSTDGGSYRSSPLRPARGRRQNSLGAPYAASSRPRSRRPGRRSSKRETDLRLIYGSEPKTDGDQLQVTGASSRSVKGGYYKSHGRRSERDVTASEKLSNLERAALELALGLTVYHFERPHKDLAMTYGAAVRDAARAPRTEGGRLNPEAQKTLQEIWDRSGSRELHEEKKTQDMIRANSPFLTASVDGESCLESVTQQHLAAAEYLLAQKPLWRSAQAEKDLEGLRTAYRNWKMLGSDSPERDTLLMEPLTSGPGKNLRARMWSALGWSLTTTFNSQVGALRTEAPVTASVTSKERYRLRQASVDEAAAMLALSLTSRENADQLKKADPDTYHSLSHMIQSLSLFRTNWQTDQWHAAGVNIALVRLQDTFEHIDDYNGKRNLSVVRATLISTKSANPETLWNAMTGQNLRVLRCTRRVTTNLKLDLCRMATQLSLDSECFERSKPERLSHLKDGAQKLFDIQVESTSATDVLNALTKSEPVRAVRDSVQSQLPKDWVTGWHFEPVLTEGDH